MLSNVKTSTSKKANKTETVVKPATKKGETAMTAKEKLSKEQQEEKERQESVQQDKRVLYALWGNKNDSLTCQIKKLEEKGEDKLTADEKDELRKLKACKLQFSTVEDWFAQATGTEQADAHNWYEIGKRIYKSIYDYRREQKDMHISMKSTDFQEKLDALQEENAELKARQDEMLQEFRMFTALFKDLMSDKEETKESE